MAMNSLRSSARISHIPNYVICDITRLTRCQVSPNIIPHTQSIDRWLEKSQLHNDLSQFSVIENTTEVSAAFLFLGRGCPTQPRISVVARLLRHIGIFYWYLNLDNCQPEVGSDVISGMADQDVGMGICANFGDSKLKPS